MESNERLVVCEKCGSENPKSRWFCVNCGARLLVYNLKEGRGEQKRPVPSYKLSEEPERGGCLTAFLVILMVANGISTVVQIFRLGEVLFDPGPGVTVFNFVSGAMLILAVSASPILFSYAIWKWKKWGMYGFGVLAAINLVIGLINWDIRSIGGIIRVAILAYLLRDAWHRMT